MCRFFLILVWVAKASQLGFYRRDKRYRILNAQFLPEASVNNNRKGNFAAEIIYEVHI
ncbi:MAG: hypothetical protein PSX80_05495 [bacterium]|nr:hypothetical protein [bacterium]